jgi:hypothetical protein
LFAGAAARGPTARLRRAAASGRSSSWGDANAIGEQDDPRPSRSRVAAALELLAGS